MFSLVWHTKHGMGRITGNEVVEPPNSLLRTHVQGLVMPKKMEQALKKEAAKKGLTGERKNAYVYGTLQKKTDWKPGKKK